MFSKVRKFKLVVYQYYTGGKMATRNRGCLEVEGAESEVAIEKGQFCLARQHWSFTGDVI